MKYFVLPYRGVEVDSKQLLFGMKKNEIHSILGRPERTLPKGVKYYGESDMYDAFFISYDEKEDVFDFIEFFGDVEVIFKEKNLFITPCNVLRSLLEVDCRKKEEGKEPCFETLKYGISVYAPDEYEEEDCLPETIGVFVKGYYD